MAYTGVTIDPGVHTAIAEWCSGICKRVYTINLKGGCDAELLKCLASRLPILLFDKIVIEDIQVITSSAISLTSAARGNLTTLAKIAGAIAFAYSRKEIRFIKAQEWKGQLKYKQLRNILKLKFGYEAKNDHEASAYGMGQYLNGKL
jgi:hypothetical protein